MSCAFKSFTPVYFSEFLFWNCSSFDISLDKILWFFLPWKGWLSSRWRVNLLYLICKSDIVARFSLHSFCLCSWRSLAIAIILVWSVFMMNIRFTKCSRRPSHKCLFLLHLLLPLVILIAALREDFFLVIDRILNLGGLSLIYPLRPISPMCQICINFLLILLLKHHFIVEIGEAKHAKRALQLLVVFIVRGCGCLIKLTVRVLLEFICRLVSFVSAVQHHTLSSSLVELCVIWESSIRVQSLLRSLGCEPVFSWKRVLHVVGHHFEWLAKRLSCVLLFCRIVICQIVHYWRRSIIRLCADAQIIVLWVSTINAIVLLFNAILRL